MNRPQSSREATTRLVALSLFAALAYGVTFIFRIPVSFLTFDAKDAVLTVAALVYGPIGAVSMSLIAALLELITISGTGFYGFLMNFVSSAVFSAVAALIYRCRRTMGGAAIGLFGGAVSMVAVMMGMNLWITPLYTGVSTADVAAMIPTLLLPFNLSKAVLNVALTLALYPPVSAALKRARLAPAGAQKTGYRMDRRTVFTLLAALLLAAAAVTSLLLLRSANA